MVKDLWFLKDACNNSHSWVIYIYVENRKMMVGLCGQFLLSIKLVT